MVFKSYHNPAGLDYDIEDDPGETESIRSTKSVKELKKTEEICKNERLKAHTLSIPTITCNKKTGKHTDEEEWKVITKGSTKPKADKYDNEKQTNNNKKKTKEKTSNNNDPKKNDNTKKTDTDSADTLQEKKQRRTTKRDGEENKTVKRKTNTEDEEGVRTIDARLIILKEAIAEIKRVTIGANYEPTPQDRRKINDEEEEEEEEINVATNSKDTTNESDKNKTNTSTQEDKAREPDNSEQNNNKKDKEDNNNNKKTSTNENNNEKGDPDGRKQSNGKSVSIIDIAEMDTFTFTIGWNPKDYRGRDGKAVLRSLLRAIVHKSPGTVFHPTNRNTAPTPRDIHSVNNDFPNTPEEFDDFFDQNTNRNRSNYRIYMKATMSHNEKELQQRMFNYLRYNKIYLNSPFIDDNTLEMVGFVENGHSRLLYRPGIELKIKKGIEEVVKGNTLSPTQKAQLRNLSNPIRVVCYSGTFHAGANTNPVICDGLILKSAKSQAKIVMELLAMLPDDIINEHYNIVPKSLNTLLGYETYGKIVADTINYTVNLTPITIINCHPSIFEDQYKTISVRKFMLSRGVISIENTSDTEKTGKYILVVTKNKAETARNAIGQMFQEFQQESGRTTAMACLQAYNMYPLVNDNVTISGHAEIMATKYRNKYKNKTATKHSPYTPYDFHGRTANSPGIEQSTAAHIPTSILNSQRNTPTPQQQSYATKSSPHLQTRRRQPQTTATKLFPASTNSPLTQNADVLTVGTPMSGLSPDDSAKTMMTNMSKMVESIGTVVTKLAVQNAETNDNMKHTNNTMKEMMIQQASQMNNLMAIMCRNEERKYEGEQAGIPITINPTSTPANSTMTNSQNSTHNQSPQKRLRIEDGDETATTMTTTTLRRQEQINEREEVADETMEDNNDDDENTTTESDIEEEVNSKGETDTNNDEEMEEFEEQPTKTAMADGDFSQFNLSSQQNKNNKETTTLNTSAKTDMETHNE